MRNIVATACILALACGLCACGPGREPYQPKYDGGMVPVAKREIASSGNVNYQGFLNLLETKRGHEHQPLAKSHVVSRQESYRGNWYRIVYYTYPRFTDEITGSAAKKIKQYYSEQAKACGALEDFPWLTGYDEIADSTGEAIQYRLQVYSVALPKGYVSVKFRRESYTGGNNIEALAVADVFDSKTGERLALGKAVDATRYAGAINQAVADYLRIKDIRPHGSYDVLAAQEQMFCVTEEGLVLLFAPGELAPATYGLIEVTVGWEKLGK